MIYILIVLQRCACENKLATRGVILAEHIKQFAVLVFQPVPLVYDHVGPRETLEHAEVWF
jgi:hypothetical protein